MLIGIGSTEYVAIQQGKGNLPMYPHGHPDPATLMNMGVYKPEWPDRKPLGFLRDLQGVSNQVPAWVWLTAGGALLTLAYFSYRGEKRG